jgi:hypothetical protein
MDVLEYFTQREQLDELNKKSIPKLLKGNRSLHPRNPGQLPRNFESDPSQKKKKRKGKKKSKEEYFSLV